MRVAHPHNLLRIPGNAEVCWEYALDEVNPQKVERK